MKPPVDSAPRRALAVDRVVRVHAGFPEPGTVLVCKGPAGAVLADEYMMLLALPCSNSYDMRTPDSGGMTGAIMSLSSRVKAQTTYAYRILAVAILR